MTREEKQDDARSTFVCNWLGDANILTNFNDRELIISRDDEDFPYLYITISTMSEEQGDKKIIELIEKQNYYEEMKRKRFITKLMQTHKEGEFKIL